MKGLFEHSGHLVRFILRRERVVSALWVVLLVAFSVGLAPGIAGILSTSEDRAAMVETMDSPAMTAMMGQLYDGDSIGSLYAFLMQLWVMIGVGLMNIFLVARHTRADEERGRAEVVRSLPVGRLSTLNAVMLTATIVNAALALFTGLGMAAMGVRDMAFGGCILYGVTLGVFGLFCAAVTAIFCQLCVSSRGALGFSGAVLASLYMIRAAGDMNAEGLSYLSPMGLLQRAQVFAGNYWWPVCIVLLETAALTAIAYALNRIRDMDQGFIPAKPGRKEAKESLLSSFGLSWRLLRNPLIAWTSGMFLMCVSYGSIMGDIETFIEGNEFYRSLMILSPDLPLAESFAATINIMLSICCVIPSLIAVFKLRGEEKDGRAEHILARAVSRTRNLAGYVALAFAASVIVPLVSVVGFYATSTAVMETPISFAFFFKATMVYLPALWVMIGLAVLLVGLIPKATVVCWAIMGYSMFILFFGRIIEGLPGWLTKITPFGYIPQLPIDEINFVTLAVLTAVAYALTAAGFAFYRRRDMLTV